MKRTKKVTEYLKAIAKDLPRQEYTFAGQLSEKGHDIIQRGISSDANGQPILPHKSYVKDIPLNRQANHQRRLRSAYDGNGFQGVKHYLKAFVKPELQGEFFEKLGKALG